MPFLNWLTSLLCFQLSWLSHILAGADSVHTAGSADAKASPPTPPFELSQDAPTQLARAASAVPATTVCAAPADVRKAGFPAKAVTAAARRTEPGASQPDVAVVAETPLAIVESQPETTKSLTAGEDSIATTEELEQALVGCPDGEVCSVSQPPLPPLLPRQLLLLLRRLPPQVRLQVLPPQPPPPLLQQQQQKKQQYAVSYLDALSVPMPDPSDHLPHRLLSCDSCVDVAAGEILVLAACAGRLPCLHQYQM